MASKRPPTLAESLDALEAQIAALGRRVTELEQQSHYVSAILQREGPLHADLLGQVGGEPVDDGLADEIEKLLREDAA